MESDLYTRGRSGAVGLLIFATMIWGFGFIATRWTLESFSPTWSITLRFVFCLPIVLPYLWLRGSFRAGFLYWRGSLAMGVFLFMGMWLQTIGLAHTTVAKAGFFTVFYIFFTPLLSVWYLREKLSALFWVLVFTAMIGMALLCELDLRQFNFGDGVVIASAVFYSLHIIAIAVVLNSFKSAIELNMMQILVVACLGLLVALLSEGVPDFSTLVLSTRVPGEGAFARPSPLIGFIFVSLFATLLAFGIQVVAQKRVAPHIASVLFLAESIFAAGFAYLFLNEELSSTALAGAVVILLAVGLVPFAIAQAAQARD